MKKQTTTTPLCCADAVAMFEPMIGIPFRELFDEDALAEMSKSKNKGLLGQLLELRLGKRLDSAPLDFIDGELKSYNADADGKCVSGGTVCITNIGSRHVDEMLSCVSFRKAWCSKKMAHVVFVGICRKGGKADTGSWFVSSVYDCDFQSDTRLSDIAAQLEAEYEELCRRSRAKVESTKRLSCCARGLRYIEHRPKSAGRIRSEMFDTVLYEKEKALYFKRNFVLDVRDALSA